MKRIISLFLSFVLVSAMVVPALAAEPDVKYYTANVAYSDNNGQLETLNLMVMDGHVYADAKVLAERMGFAFAESDEGVLIVNKDTSSGVPFGITKFEYGSTRVSHSLLYKIIDDYEAPFESVRNDRGSWIPFEYALLTMNSSMMISGNVITIDAPQTRIVDCLYEVGRNLSRYGFDWADDFGYVDSDVTTLGAASHLVNVFNGVLEFDGASWIGLFLPVSTFGPLLQSTDSNMPSYDVKYGESLATLICTESDDELEATIEYVELMSDLLDGDNPFNPINGVLKSIASTQDQKIGDLIKACDEALEEVKRGNSPLVKYNKSYQALESAFDAQGRVINTSSFTNVASKGLVFFSRVLEAVEFAHEFENHDDFTTAALNRYLIMTAATGTSSLTWTMRNSMAAQATWLTTDTTAYVGKQFLEMLPELLMDYESISKALGEQGNAALLAWSLVSKVVPGIKYSLTSADSFELALYSQLFQCDTLLNYQAKRDAVFSDGNVTRKELYELSQYCYVLLKSCYVTRAAALDSLEGKRKSLVVGQVLGFEEKIQPLIDEQEGINEEIACILEELKGACESNEGDNRLVFGFLSDDSKKCLREYDDIALVKWLEEASSKGELGVANADVTADGDWYYLGVGSNFNNGSGNPITPKIVRVSRKDPERREVLWEGTCYGMVREVRLQGGRLYAYFIPSSSQGLGPATNKEGEDVRPCILSMETDGTGATTIVVSKNHSESYRQAFLIDGSTLYYGDGVGDNWEVRKVQLDGNAEDTVCKGTLQKGYSSNVSILGTVNGKLYFSVPIVESGTYVYVVYATTLNDGGNYQEVMRVEGFSTPLLVDGRLRVAEGGELASYSLDGDDRKTIAKFGDGNSNSYLLNASSRYAIVTEGNKSSTIDLRSGSVWPIEYSTEDAFVNIVDDKIVPTLFGNGIQLCDLTFNPEATLWPGADEGQEKANGKCVLCGRVRVHEEYSGTRSASFQVTSLLLDAPIPYTYEYKNTVDAVAQDVALEVVPAGEPSYWSQYDGKHISVSCEGLHGAIHSASDFRVDTLVVGELTLISVDD